MTTTQPTPGQEARVPAVVQQFRSDLGKMESQFKMALPAHIAEREPTEAKPVSPCAVSPWRC